MPSHRRVIGVPQSHRINYNTNIYNTGERNTGSYLALNRPACAPSGLHDRHFCFLPASSSDTRESQT